MNYLRSTWIVLFALFTAICVSYANSEGLESIPTGKYVYQSKWWNPKSWSGVIEEHNWPLLFRIAGVDDNAKKIYGLVRWNCELTVEADGDEAIYRIGSASPIAFRNWWSNSAEGLVIIGASRETEELDLANGTDVTEDEELHIEFAKVNGSIQPISYMHVINHLPQPKDPLNKYLKWALNLLTGQEGSIWKDVRESFYQNGQVKLPLRTVCPNLQRVK